ncbi:MAG: hypothetical protein FJ146_16285 [Deltaproteobacteria bacterium]|nr:hypothetical protein [Deltaproteobacteria bacterium]
MPRANLAIAICVSLTALACEMRTGLRRAPAQPEPRSPISQLPDTASDPAQARDQAGTTGKVLTVSLTEGLKIPRVVKANALVAKFTSSEPDATFECERDGNGRFVPCQDGGVYDFGRLIHQRGYSLNVRARSADGRLSPEPLAIRFAVDLVTGEPPSVPLTVPPTTAPELTNPGSATELPPVLVSPPTAASGRSLQLGSFYAVQVPFDTRVITYATSKTYNGRLLTITMLHAPINTLFTQNNSCQHPYEKIVFTSDQVPYCEGTPNLEELSLNTVQMPPLNFVNLALSVNGGILAENLLFAAFEQGSEPIAEGNIKLNQCRPDLPQGSVTMPLIPKFYGGREPGHIHWCQYQDGAGLWWWGAVVTSSIGSGDDAAATLKIYYSVSASLGMITETQVVDRLQRIVLPLLLPITDVP